MAKTSNIGLASPQEFIGQFLDGDKLLEEVTHLVSFNKNYDFQTLLYTGAHYRAKERARTSGGNFQKILEEEMQTAETQIKTIQDRLFDIKDMGFSHDSDIMKLSNGVDWSFVPGLTAEFYEHTFGNPNSDQHNAGADEQSQAEIFGIMAADPEKAMKLMRKEVEMATKAYEKETGKQAFTNEGGTYAFSADAEFKAWMQEWFKQRGRVIQEAIAKGNPIDDLTEDDKEISNQYKKSV